MLNKNHYEVDISIKKDILKIGDSFSTSYIEDDLEVSASTSNADVIVPYCPVSPRCGCLVL
jgi:hypothetical protein